MKKILFITCCLYSLTAFSQIDHSQWETKEFKSYIQTSLTDSMLQAKSKANACAEMAMNTNVSQETITTINKLHLKENEATAALAFLAYKAQAACVGDITLDYISYLQLARKLGINGYDETSDPTFKNLTPLLFDREQEIRFKYLFLMIAKDKRETLEKIEELKKPFNISILSKIETAK